MSPAPNNGCPCSPAIIISSSESPVVDWTIYDDQERLAKCKNIIDSIQNNDLDKETIFTGIADDEHAYIIQFIDEDDNTQGKFVYHPDSEKFIVTFPSQAHKQPITQLNFAFQTAITSIGHDNVLVQVRAHANSHFSGDSIHADPDIHIICTPFVDIGIPNKSTSLWILENCLSQTESAGREKIQSHHC
ncbi:hypothetical protein F4604DRAFT_1914447 [Suillus subluteus]|nr:hypothetical protein F4604DRAFT_1914447 [Suillus subluteus]